jgi:radical SAM superfamily enzyme YgiQ (UPF0313 family)
MKIKKALLIYPPTGMYMRDDRCQAPVNGLTAQPMRAPLDLAYMAATLTAAQVECIIKDYPSENQDWRNFQHDLQHYNPDMLVISITTPTMKADMMAAAYAKHFRKDILVVTKGAHNSAKDEEVLAAHADLDVVIRGESEFAVAEIAAAESFDTVLGITFRKNGKIVRTPPRPFLENLDALPNPARHLLNNRLYRTPDTGEPMTLIDTARGCPYQCIFCAVPLVSGNTIRRRSPLSIVNEIEECIHEYGIRNFFFRADTFTFDEEWVIQICQLIVGRKLSIRWGTNSRVTSLNETRAAWMKKAGCWILGFGIESGSQTSLDRMKKSAELRDARNAVSLCRKYGIKVYMLFLIGLPWDTKESIRETIAFAKTLDGDYLDMNIAYPIPGTEFFEISKKDGLFNEAAMHGFDYSHPLTKTEYVSTHDLVRLRRAGLVSFYLRPRYGMRILSSVKSFRERMRYLGAGCALILKLFGNTSHVTEPIIHER